MDWYSPKHVERILKIKSNHKTFVHLVGLYTYCKMHGAYNVKHTLRLCNTHCFSTATMVARNRLNVTFKYIDCSVSLSLSFVFKIKLQICLGDRIHPHPQIKEWLKHVLRQSHSEPLVLPFGLNWIGVYSASAQGQSCSRRNVLTLISNNNVDKNLSTHRITPNITLDGENPTE